MTARWSLRRRIGLGYLILVAAVVALVIGFRLALRSVVRAQDQVSAQLGRNLLWSERLGALAARAEADGEACTLFRDRRDLAAMRTTFVQFDSLLSALHSVALDATSVQLMDEVAAAREDTARSLEALVRDGPSPGGRQAVVSAEERLANGLAALSAHQRGRLAETRRASLHSAEQASGILTAIALGGALLAAAGAVLYTRAIAAAVERDQAQEHYRALVEGVKDYAIVLLDQEGRVERFNPAAERIFGFSADEARGVPLSRFYPRGPSAERRAKHALAQAEREGRYEEQGWRTRRDGSVFWSTSALAPISDGGGGVRGFSFICRDTSAHRRAEQERTELLARERHARHRLQEALGALQKAERRERRLYASNLIGVFFFRLEGGLTEANDAFLELVGQPREKLATGELGWDALVPPERRAALDEALGGLAREGVFTPFETELVRGAGGRVQVLLGAALLEGNPPEGVAFVLDTSERQRATSALRFLAEASTLLSSSLDYATTLARVARLAVPRLADWCMVELEDASGQLGRVAVVHRDEAKDELAQRLLGPLSGSIPRPPVLGSCEPERVEDVSELMREVAAGPGEREVVEQLGFHAAMVVPLFVRHRAMGAMLLVSADPQRGYGPADLELAVELAQRCASAVDNARLYYEAQEAIRTRDEFLSIASHELKTPLTSLKLMVQSSKRLAQGLPQDDREQLVSKLEGIDRQAGRVARLTDELLDISRVRLGRLELSREQLELGELVREVVARFREESAMRGTAIALRIGGPAFGFWDRSRIEQVVSNLVGNALKYGGGRPVAVEVAAADGKARLTVRDEGIGIPLDQQARIFERFERAVSSRHFGGLGLGLYIVRQIVTAHGGNISLESRPGQGSTFTVQLPLTAHARYETPAPAPH